MNVHSLWAVALLASVPALAAHPNLSGEWHLNLDQSDFGSDYPVPSATVQKIAHKDPSLIIELTESVRGSERTGTLKYTTDGREVTNEVIGTTMRATALWDADELVIHTWGDVNGDRIDLVDRWILSDKGRTLTVKRHFESRDRKASQVIVLDKIKPPK